MRRIQGALLPDTEVVWMEDGEPLDQAMSYTWICEAAHQTGTTPLWTKTTGITPTTTGFLVAWAVGDLGSLVAGSYSRPREYVLEFTGTMGTKTRKHQIEVTIDPQVGT